MAEHSMPAGTVWTDGRVELTSGGGLVASSLSVRTLHYLLSNFVGVYKPYEDHSEVR